ncbi:MAG: DUF2442 domain-containing protein [Candidatus Desantisbacteria bacterium]
MNPRVTKVIPSDDYKLILTFTNGERKIYDCYDLLNFGVFEELQDKNYFKQVKITDGTTTWPHEQDLCPDTLYMDSIKENV